MDAIAFRRACAKFCTGIVVASVTDSNLSPHGVTVNSFTSVSASPALVLICLDHNSTVLPAFRSARYYGLSVLAEDQRAVSKRFAQRGQDRFEGVSWLAGTTTGVPLIPGALAHFECEIRSTVDAGDHTILIAEVLSADTSEGKPLVYFESGYRHLE